MALIVRAVVVPGVQPVPGAMDMATLHSPPATHIWYELPSLEQEYSPTVHEPELEDVEPPDVAVPVEAAVVAAGDESAVGVSAEPEPLPVGFAAGADAALVANTPPPPAAVAVADAVLELAAELESLPLAESPPELVVPSNVTPVAKQLSPVMSA